MMKAPARSPNTPTKAVFTMCAVSSLAKVQPSKPRMLFISSNPKPIPQNLSRNILQQSGKLLMFNHVQFFSISQNRCYMALQTPTGLVSPTSQRSAQPCLTLQCIPRGGLQTTREACAGHSKNIPCMFVCNLLVRIEFAQSSCQHQTDSKFDVVQVRTRVSTNLCWIHLPFATRIWPMLACAPGPTQRPTQRPTKSLGVLRALRSQALPSKSIIHLFPHLAVCTKYL